MLFEPGNVVCAGDMSMLLGGISDALCMQT